MGRSFYHNRNIIVLDESTSSLDHDTEEEILKEIKNYLGKTTIIMIAHRISTLRYCDRIYELKNKKINNILTYNELITMTKKKND